MARLQITCIRKMVPGTATTYTGIEEFQGIDENGKEWTRSRTDAANASLDGTDTYFLVHEGKETEVIGEQIGDIVYLRSESNDMVDDNLYELDECE